MPTVAKLFIVARVCLVTGFIVALILCEDQACQLAIGGVGIGVIGVSMYAATRHALKIGRDSGETKAMADMLREHFRLHENEPG